MIQEMKFDYRKATQAINLLANRYDGKKINKMKALKLIWAADRYHMRKYGRPVIGDKYIAMKFGPVASGVKDIMDGNVLQDEYLEYADDFIKEIDRYNIRSVSDVDKDVFSESDLEALNFALENFGNIDRFKLSKMTHDYPEWKRYQQVLESGKSIWEVISYMDFFNDPTDVRKDLFKIDKEIIEDSKMAYQESNLINLLI